MKLFEQKENLKTSLPLIALMSALCIVIIALMNYFPFLNLVLIFILPIPCAIIGLFIKSRFYPIFFVVTFALSALVTMFNFAYCLFDLLPSLILGFFLGLLIKQKLSLKYILVIISTVIALINVGNTYLIEAIFKVKMINQLFAIINVNVEGTLEIFIPTVIYAYSLIETFILLLISLGEIKKIYQINESFKTNYLLSVTIPFALAITSLICYFFNISFFYLFMFLSVVSSAILYDFESKTLQNSIIFIILVVITWLVYVATYSNFVLINSFVIMLVFPILISIKHLTILILNNIKNKV